MKRGRPVSVTVSDLRELHSRGYSAKEAAIYLDCTVQTVRNHARFQNIGFERDPRGRKRGPQGPSERTMLKTRIFLAQRLIRLSTRLIFCARWLAPELWEGQK